MGREDDQLLCGDAAAFAAFYRRFEDPVLGFFLTRTGRGELAADLTAETFARALEGRSRFDAARGDASAWLFGIAHNLLASSLKRGRVEDEVRVKVELSNARVQLTQTPLKRYAGAYLFVLTPAQAGRQPLRLTTTYANGSVCRKLTRLPLDGRHVPICRPQLG